MSSKMTRDHIDRKRHCPVATTKWYGFSSWSKKTNGECIERSFRWVKEKKLFCKIFVCPDIVMRCVFIKGDDCLSSRVCEIVETLMPTFPKIKMNDMKRLEINVVPEVIS